MCQQLSLPDDQLPLNLKNDSRSGTFTDNMKLPIHRWFRYSAGFSSEWAQRVISDFNPSMALDPFSGSGTTLLAAEQCNVQAFGFESHPFIVRVANAKLLWNNPTNDVHALSKDLLQKAIPHKSNISEEAELLHKCYDQQTLAELCALRDIFQQIKKDISPSTAEIIWLAITCILRVCSSAGTAQWQYVLPNKKKSKVLSPFSAFQNKIEEIISDMNFFQHYHFSDNATILQHDAREPYAKLKGQIDLVVTSPPYPNNYDYADATRLEMCFWGEISKWGDLQNAVRQYIIRSCSQHAAADKLDMSLILGDPLLEPIHDELSDICNKLGEVRHQHGGKKAYHLMIAAYFADLAKIFHTLRDICKVGSNMCFVIGDSAPYGVYVPVDDFLGRLAVSSGFSSFSFEKIRDRNIKWKNRKHRVPLKEGRLWIEG